MQPNGVWIPFCTNSLLEICVLASIKDEESYGYQIIKDVKPYIEISESTLYPILRRLETQEY